MANYIITKNKSFFEKIGNYNYCNLSDMVLPKNIGVDTETTSLYPRKGNLFAIQIGTGTNNYLIDLQLHNDGFIPEDVFPYLKGKNMVFHNACFDIGWFYKHNFFPKNVFDTMLASQLLYNGIRAYRHGFGHVMERELGIEVDKSEQNNIHNTQLRTSKAIQYCFNDVDRLGELMRVLGKKIRKRNLTEAFLLHCRYVRALAYMEQCGLPTSTERWKEKMVQDQKDYLDAKAKVIDYIHNNLPHYRNHQETLYSELFGEESVDTKITCSIGSQKQMVPVFKDLEINIIDDKGKESIKESIIKQSGHEFVDIWLEYQHCKKDITTYGNSIFEKIEDERLYTNFRPLLDTARISTRKGAVPFLVFPGNEKTRRCFVAPKGRKMIVCDYEGQENAVGADYHQDPVMVASLNEGLDLHCAFARLIFPELENLSDDEIKENHKDKRDFAKPSRFAFAYGGNGYTVAINQNLSMEEGHRLEKLFKELHAGVYEWGEKKLKESMKEGYIESVDGFRLILPYFDEYKENEKKIQSFSADFWKEYKLGKEQYKKQVDIKQRIEEGEDLEPYEPEDKFAYDTYMRNKKLISKTASRRSEYFRLCLNNPIQSKSAFQTKRATCILFEAIEAEGDLWRARISNIPHDEIVMEVDNDLVDKYKPILENSMIEGGEHYLMNNVVKMKAEANVGEDWYSAK